MVHALGCNFIETITLIQEGSWYDLDDGPNYLSINEKEIIFDNGWGIYPRIRFNYCPHCGVKMEE